MKKVLHLITGLEPHGGAEKMLLKTLPYLKNTENRVCCITGHGEIGRKLEQKGIVVYYLNAKTKYSPGVILRYKRVIERYKPDIQVNYLIHADLFGRFFGKRFGAGKMIAYIRNKHLDLPFLLKLDKWTSKKIDFFLFNSKAVRNFYINKLGIAEEKTKCIPNGIDLGKFNIEIDWKKKRQELGLTENDFVIINVARLYKSKRQIDILQAINKLKNPNIKYLQVSVGDQEKALKNFVAENNLNDQVQFLGYRDDIIELLRISNLYVSAAAHEGMSNSLLEAMAAAKPCLVSNIEENTELVKNKINGMIFKTKDVNELAEKIAFGIKDYELIKKFGLKAKQAIEENYDIKKIIAQLDEFLFKFV